MSRDPLVLLKSMILDSVLRRSEIHSFEWSLFWDSGSRARALRAWSTALTGAVVTIGFACCDEPGSLFTATSFRTFVVRNRIVGTTVMQPAGETRELESRK